MWLSLIPQIHSPGDSPDLSMRHHHFIEENPQFYDGKRIFAIILASKWNWKFSFFSLALFPTGKIRLQSLVRPSVIKISAPLTTATPKHKTEKTPSPLMPSMTTGKNRKIQNWHQMAKLPFTHSASLLIFLPSFFFLTMQQNVHHRIAQSFRPSQQHAHIKAKIAASSTTTAYWDDWQACTTKAMRQHWRSPSASVVFCYSSMYLFSLPSITSGRNVPHTPKRKRNWLKRKTSIRHRRQVSNDINTKAAENRVCRVFRARDLASIVATMKNYGARRNGLWLIYVR